MDNDKNRLVNVYDFYGDFSLDKYFANKYDVIPSHLALHLDTDEDKKTFDKALGLIDYDSYDLSVLRKKWTISRNKNDDRDEDYVFYQILESNEVGVCIEIEVNHDRLSVKFLYDQKNNRLEGWIKNQMNVLRDEFGSSKSPVFRILTNDHNCFDTERVKIDLFNIDIEGNYNEDFKKVDVEIRASIEGKESGLILLHGKPGTGKTSYIKSLVSKYVAVKFIFIPNDFVNELLKPAFITFLIKQKNAIIIIEDAEKIIMSRDQAGENSVVSTILQLTDGLFSDYLNIKVICTFNTDLSRVDKALFRKGRMIAFYEFKELSKEKTLKLLNDKNKAAKKGLTLAEIYHFNKSDYSTVHIKKSIGYN